MASEHPAAGGPGLQLAHDYLHGVVEPLLAERCQGVRYAAARVGTGSEVLGLDDAISRDHDWGLRLQLFVPEEHVPGVLAALERYLPDSFQGHRVRFAFSGHQAPRLGLEVTSPTRFAHDRLGFDPTDGATTTDWLSVSGQAALEVVGGEVFTDQVGDLTRLRRALSWYPDDLWRYVVACDWQRLNQELPLMARAGDRGDDLGSRTIAARLVDIAVHLAFTLSRSWQPYSKWRGTMFGALPVAAAVAGELIATLAADDWSARNQALRPALERLAGFQSEVGLPTAAPAVVPFWDRPYLQVEPSLVPALMGSIADPAVQALPVGVGAIEQQTDNVDVLVDPARRRAVVEASHSVSA
jgi:hypothetical protein